MTARHRRHFIRLRNRAADLSAVCALVTLAGIVAVFVRHG